MLEAVEKYGGSSMAQPQVVLQRVEQSDPTVIVVSAPGKDLSFEGCQVGESGGVKMTDMLLGGDEETVFNRAQEVAARANLSHRDTAIVMDDMRQWIRQYEGNRAGIAATGERFSAYLVALATGRELLDPRELISIDHNRAPDRTVSISNLRRRLDPSRRYVLPGFYGYDNSAVGEVQILERGGSDVSGALAAAALQVPYFNLSDVDGFYTTDPRFNDAARLISHLTYREARAMALGGSGLLHHEVARIMGKVGQPTIMGNTFSAAIGTSVSDTVEGGRSQFVATASRPVFALDISKIGIDEDTSVMRRVYDGLADQGIPYLFSADGPDETTIILADTVVDSPETLQEVACAALSEADVVVREQGLVVAVLSGALPYARSQETIASLMALADPEAIVTGSFGRQSVSILTDVDTRSIVEHHIHELVGQI